MILFLVLSSGLLGHAFAGAWQMVETETLPTKRHEAAFTELNGKFYLLGGRGIKPLEVLDPKTGRWEKKSPTPIELHHFQAVAYREELYVVGAFTGPYPNETPVPVFYIYDPKTDEWRTGESVPPARRRGAAGAVIDGDHLYLVCGIVHGHQGDFVPWLDKYDLRTGEWTVLADAPHARDHFQAVLHEGRIVNAGGRQSSGWTKQVFQLTVPEVDVYDLATSRWDTLAEPIPTPRAGCFASSVGDWVVIAGGESGTQRQAHSEVEAVNIKNGHWKALARLITGRHGTGLAYWKGALYTASGCARRGGSPEQDTTEMLIWE